MATVNIPSASNLIQVPVNGGDLFAIALQYLGNALQWDRIAALNGLKDPILPAGVPFTLLIPPVDPGATNDGYVTGGWGRVSSPVNISLPTISGSPNITFTLDGSTGTWTTPTQHGDTQHQADYAPISYTFQWNTNGVPNPGATGLSYTVVPIDLGLGITLTVTASNIAGSTSATSAPVIAGLGVPTGPSLSLRLDWTIGTLGINI